MNVLRQRFGLVCMLGRALNTLLMVLFDASMSMTKGHCICWTALPRDYQHGVLLQHSRNDAFIVGIS